MPGFEDDDEDEDDFPVSVVTAFGVRWTPREGTRLTDSQMDFPVAIADCGML